MIRKRSSGIRKRKRLNLNNPNNPNNPTVQKSPIPHLNTSQNKHASGGGIGELKVLKNGDTMGGMNEQENGWVSEIRELSRQLWTRIQHVSYHLIRVI